MTIKNRSNVSLLFAIWVLLGTFCEADDPSKAKESETRDQVTQQPSDNPLDIIPVSASAAIAIRNVAELSTRGDELIQKTEMKFPWRFSDAYKWLVGLLGIGKVVDDQGSAALMQLGEVNDYESLVLVVPTKNLDVVAAEMKVPRDELRPGKVIDRKEYSDRDVALFPNYIAIRGNHLLLGLKEESVRLATVEKSLAEELSKETRQPLEKDDLLLFARGEIARRLVETNLTSTKDSSNLSGRAAEDGTLGLSGITRDLTYVVGGVRIDRGVGATFLLEYSGQRSRQTLQQLALGVENASPVGLPEGRAIAIHMGGGDGDASAGSIESLLHVLAKAFSVKVDQFVSQVQHSKLMTIFLEGWKRADGSCSGLYLNQNPDQHGAFSLISILRTDDGQGFIRDMAELGPFLNASLLEGEDSQVVMDQDAIDDLIDQLAHPRFRTRQLAFVKLQFLGSSVLPRLEVASRLDDPEIQARVRELKELIRERVAAEQEAFLRGTLLSKLRLQFFYLPKEEHRRGQSVDVIKIQFKGPSGLPKEGSVGTMQRLFGPDWSTIRVAVIENDVVFLLGSDTTLFDQSLELLQQGKTGISDKHFERFRQRNSVKSKVELHLAIRQVDRLASGQGVPPEAQASEEPLTSIGVVVAPQRLRLDAFVPFEDFKVISNRFGR